MGVITVEEYPLFGHRTWRIDEEHAFDRGYFLLISSRRTVRVCGLTRTLLSFTTKINVGDAPISARMEMVARRLLPLVICRVKVAVKALDTLV